MTLLEDRRTQTAIDIQRRRGAAPFDGDQEALAAQTQNVAVTSSLDQPTCASHATAVEGPFPAASGSANPKEDPLPDPSSLDHEGCEAQSTSVEGTLHPAAIQVANPMADPRRGPFLYDPLLCLLADSLDDLEKLRIATDNRIRALTRSEADSDGEYRGLGLDARSPQVARVMAIAEGIASLEHQATLDLRRQLRAHPLNSWVQRQKGVGEKQAARLLAAVGDPYWNDLHDRPRTVSELWAYCGYAVTSGHAQRRTKGVKANWNDDAKMRVYLMAESCVKSLGGHYRGVYEAARVQYTDAIHPHDCVRCGPAGKPALAGTPLSLGHQHARALRRVAKEILRDLWIEGRALHETPAV